jgi:hypothetical protein
MILSKKNLLPIIFWPIAHTAHLVSICPRSVARTHVSRRCERTLKDRAAGGTAAKATLGEAMPWRRTASGRQVRQSGVRSQRSRPAAPRPSVIQRHPQSAGQWQPHTERRTERASVQRGQEIFRLHLLISYYFLVFSHICLL